MIQLVSGLESIFVSPQPIMSPIIQYFHGHEHHQPDTNHITSSTNLTVRLWMVLSWETLHMILPWDYLQNCNQDAKVGNVH